LKLNSMLI